MMTQLRWGNSGSCTPTGMPRLQPHHPANYGTLPHPHTYLFISSSQTITLLRMHRTTCNTSQVSVNILVADVSVTYSSVWPRHPTKRNQPQLFFGVNSNTCNSVVVGCYCMAHWGAVLFSSAKRPWCNFGRTLVLLSLDTFYETTEQIRLYKWVTTRPKRRSNDVSFNSDIAHKVARPTGIWHGVQVVVFRPSAISKLLWLTVAVKKLHVSII